MTENEDRLLSKEIKDRLYIEQKKINCLEAPADLEERLRTALRDSSKGLRYEPKEPTHKRSRNPRGLIAALITLILVLSYSYDSLAYYGKMALGYQTIVNGNITLLQEQGAGQEISRSYRFSDGTEVTLDGIMYDEKELVAFYKVSRKNIRSEHVTLLMEIDGINPMSYSAAGGTGQLVDDDTIFWVQSFQAPEFYEKWLTLKMTLAVKGRAETGSIPFTLDRSKAVKRMVKQPINQIVELDGFRIHFGSLTASRLNTTIEGTIEPLSGLDREKYKESGHNSLQYDIYIDGKLYSTGYAGVSPVNKTEFSSESMGLPSEFKSVELRDIRLVRMVMVDQSAPITSMSKQVKITEDLMLEGVTEGNGVTTLKIASRGIPVMGLFDGEQQIPGDVDKYLKLPESLIPVSRLYTFQGNNQDLKLMIKAINYSQYAAERIQIYLVSYKMVDQKIISKS